MIKKLPLFLLIAVFMTSIVYAQTRNVQIHKKQIIDENVQTTASTTVDYNQVPPNYPLDAGDQFITTGYDYETNVATRRMIDLADLDQTGGLDPIMVAMKRDVVRW